MATLEQLGSALINADAAGDVSAARMLAAEITRIRGIAALTPPAQPPMQTEAASAPVPSMSEGMMPQGMEPVQASGPGLGAEIGKVGSKLNDWARLAANGATFGLADKFAGGMDALTGRAPSYDAGTKANRAETQAIRDRLPESAVVEGLGGLGGGVGLMKSGLTLAGRFGPSLLGRTAGYGLEGGAYGAAHGAGNTYSDKLSDYIKNAKDSATTGALIGGALPVAGTAAGAAYRLGSAFLGPRVEGLGRGASAMLRGAAQADEAGLRALPGMGPEAMLVDAGPAMRGLGQGAGTGTGEGRSALANALKVRDDRTGERLARSLDENLGPSPVPSQVEAGLAGARQELAPAYQQVFQGARPVDTSILAERLNGIAMSERGPAHRAARQVREMLNDPVATRELDRNPQALLNTRQAIDGIIANEVDPNTIRVLTQARQAVDTELSNAVPGIKAVDAQFAELSRQSSGLQRGSQVLDSGKTAIRPVELVDELRQGALPQGEMIGPSAAPTRLRQGTRAELDRLVGTNVNDLNTLERKIGTPQDWNSQKLGTIFGEGPRDRVTEALMNNRKFRQSYQDIVQGSQTAQRTASANAMDGAAGGNVPHDSTMTGLGLKALNLVSKAISGASTARTKDEIGKVLASQGPEVQRLASELLLSAYKTGQNSKAILQVMSSPYWISASTPASGRKAKQ
jgi:hypothetical protein